jgi:hypothetical protein
VHAPAVLHRHRVRVVPGHERHRAARVKTVELGETPKSGLAGVIGRIVPAGQVWSFFLEFGLSVDSGAGLVEVQPTMNSPPLLEVLMLVFEGR